MLGVVGQPLPTLLGPRTLITLGLQRLIGCILPTMHCRSQTCWPELLHPFAHHCQHARNNSQQCWELLRPFASSLTNGRMVPFSLSGSCTYCGPCKDHEIFLSSPAITSNGVIAAASSKKDCFRFVFLTYIKALSLIYV